MAAHKRYKGTTTTTITTMKSPLKPPPRSDEADQDQQAPNIFDIDLLFARVVGLLDAPDVWSLALTSSGTWQAFRAMRRSTNDCMASKIQAFSVDQMTSIDSAIHQNDYVVPTYDTCLPYGNGDYPASSNCCGCFYCRTIADIQRRRIIAICIRWAFKLTIKNATFIVREINVSYTEAITTWIAETRWRINQFKGKNFGTFFKRMDLLTLPSRWVKPYWRNRERLVESNELLYLRIDVISSYIEKNFPHIRIARKSLATRLVYRDFTYTMYGLEETRLKSLIQYAFFKHH